MATLHPEELLARFEGVDDVIAMWSVRAARDAAWTNAEALWNLPPPLTDNLKHSIDGLTTVVGKTLLVPVA